MTTEHPEDIETTEEENVLDLEDDMNALANERGHSVILLNGPMDKFVIEWGTTAAQIASIGNKRLSILLNSLGGSGQATYKMILSMRQYADEIDVLVPRYANSAATLFCLGADTIYMGKEGELGPLDPQILDRTGIGRRVSALETFKGLEHLLEHSLEAFNSTVRFLLRSAPMDIHQAMEHAKPLFASIVSPLYQNVDLHELGEAGRDLAEVEEYALRAMQRWGYKNVDEADIRRIARKLVWEYPSHEFVIDLTEAQDIGLNAKPMSDVSESFEDTANRIVDRLDVREEVAWWGIPDMQVERGNADCVPPTTDKEGNGDDDEPK